MKTRFAPSPTGYLHIGGVRTALYSWLEAKKNNGTFLLRVEDTDRERSTDEAVQVILEGMQWLGLTHDEGPIFQTHRFDRYAEVIDQLLKSGHAYHCYCTRERLDQRRAEQMAAKQKPRYDGHCRGGNCEHDEATPFVIRFKNPLDGDVVIDDQIKGKVVVSNQELDDLIIARTDGTPTYNLTVVVDDMDMQVTDVIRGDDHLNNTPRQINILRALGAELPNYAHVSMILGPDGQKLSKRHGAVSVLEYRTEGYLPQALLNYLVRLGWSHGDQEIFTEAEMIEFFDVTNASNSASTFNPEKLLWVNQQYIKTMPAEELLEPLQWQFDQAGIDSSNGPSLTTLIETQRDRVQTLKEMAEQSRFFYEEFAEYDAKAAKKNLRPVVLEPMLALVAALEALDDWSAERLNQAIVDSAEKFEMKMGKLALPTRVSVTGGSASPSLDITLETLGKEKTLLRLRRGVEFIKNRAEG